MSLPVELVLDISTRAAHLDRETSFALALTCRAVHHAVSSVIFHTIILDLARMPRVIALLRAPQKMFSTSVVKQLIIDFPAGEVPSATKALFSEVTQSLPAVDRLYVRAPFLRDSGVVVPWNPTEVYIAAAAITSWPTWSELPFRNLQRLFINPLARRNSLRLPLPESLPNMTHYGFEIRRWSLLDNGSVLLADHVRQMLRLPALRTLMVHVVDTERSVGPLLQALGGLRDDRVRAMVLGTRHFLKRSWRQFAQDQRDWWMAGQSVGQSAE